MKVIEIIKKIKNKLGYKIKELPEHIEGYSTFTESIDDINLIEMFEKQLPKDLRLIVDYSESDIYNRKLYTQISSEQLLKITKEFFKNIDSQISYRVNSIIDRKDDRFNLNIDSNGNGKNQVSNPNKIPIDIDVTQYGDLRDVYGLVHELTHCLDIDNGDTDTRKILGEVAPQCMERLLDKYLMENGKSLDFNMKVLSKDIEKRNLTTFISRAQNAIHFNSLRKSDLERSLDQEKDSRYVLAQIYQFQLMKNDKVHSKNKLVDFINCVKNNDFYGANKVFGMQIDSNNKLQREILVKDSVMEGKDLYDNLSKKPNNIKDININDIDLNNSYFHFTAKDNLEKINKEGLKAKIGDASKIKDEEKPRVYMSKGGKGIIAIKNSFIYEFKKLKICDIPEEYRKYFDIRDFSSNEQVNEVEVYKAMEKRFKDEVYFKVDAVEGEDFLPEDFLPEKLKNNIKLLNNVRDVKGKEYHDIDVQKLSIIKTDKGDTALDVVEYLYNRLLEKAKEIGKEDAVKLVNSDLNGLFEYIKQREKNFDER